MKAYVKSRLKKKAAGWLMALGRIIAINPELAAAILRDADKMYREQVHEEPPIPWAVLADLIETGWQADGIEPWLRPLCNLRRYTPWRLEWLADTLVSDPNEHWERRGGDEEGEASTS